MRQDDFAKNLIKGRIAETVFEQMFCDAGDYTVIPFGMEKTFPELLNYNKLEGAKKVVDTLRDSPDYVLIPPNRKSVLIVEVKFRRAINMEEIVKIATKQKIRWHPSWLFVATLNDFYLGQCETIITYRKIFRLRKDLVNLMLQAKYLKLIKKFEK